MKSAVATVWACATWTALAGGTQPPNIEAVTYGVNVLLGKTPAEQRTELVGEQLFVLSGEAGTVNGYTRHQQISDMAAAEDCSWSGVSRQVSWATSASTLESQSKSSSNGYDQQSTIGVSVPVGPAEVSAETTTRNALVFGNSKTSTKQWSSAQSGMSYTYDATARRNLYSVEVGYAGFGAADWTDTLKTACDGLGDAPTDAQVVAFFQRVGSHGLATASLGQTCTSSMFMENGQSLTAYYELNEQSSSNEVAMMWWTSSHSTSQTDESGQSTEYGFSYVTSNKRCVGEIATASSCSGNMYGTRDAPAIVKWTYAPIWTMNVPTLRAGAKARMKTVFERMMQAAVDCRGASCNGHGSCAPKASQWNSAPASVSYASYFDGAKCFCDDDWTDSRCGTARAVQVGTPTRTAGYQNEYDQVLDYFGYDGRKAAPLCGVSSRHDNGREDRQFQLASCSLNDKNAQYARLDGAVSDTFYTWWDSTYTLECEADKVVVGMYSQHDNGREDRRTKLRCQRVGGTVTRSCSWSSNWENAYDEQLSFDCATGKVLAGMQSRHDNNKEDRQFKFKCCELAVDAGVYQAISRGAWTNYVNDWDGKLEYRASGGALYGVSSFHDNNKEDRRFRFAVSPHSGARGDWTYYGYSSYDEGFTYTCPGDKVVSYLLSYHDNGKEDRKWKVGCQSFSGGTVDMCQWTEYVNEWDQPFDYQCGDRFVLHGLSSYHNNNVEDRRFKFQCCRWKFAASRDENQLALVADGAAAATAQPALPLAAAAFAAVCLALAVAGLKAKSARAHLKLPKNEAADGYGAALL